MLARLAIVAMLTSSTALAQASGMSLNGYGFEGQGGAFGGRPSAGLRINIHLISDVANLTGQYEFLLHAGPYGLRNDESLFVGKLFEVADAFHLEPYLGLDLTLNSVAGFASWGKPGVIGHLRFGETRLELNAAALLEINFFPGKAGSGAAFEGRVYFSDSKEGGWYFGAQTQFLPVSTYLLGVVGWAIAP